MTVEELITKSAHEVRGNRDLMERYLLEYEAKFGRRPNCAGCTFSKDWQKFVNSFKPQRIKNQIQMDTTFKLKKVSNKIYTYWIDGKPQRKYDNKMTEEFAIGYLTNGTPEQIEERKKQFFILPESLREVKKVEEEVKEKKPKAKRTSKAKK